MPLFEKQPTLHERQMIYAIYDALTEHADKQMPSEERAQAVAYAKLLQELLDYVRMYDKCSIAMKERVKRSLIFIFEGRV